MEKWPTLLVKIDEINQKENKRNDKSAIFSSRIKETVRKCTSEKMISFMKFDTKHKIFAHCCKKSKDSGRIENWNSHTIYTLIHNIHIPFRAFGVSSYTQSSKNSPQLIFHMLDMPLNGIKLEKNAFSLVLRSLTLHEKQTSQMSRQSQGWRKV